VNQTKGEVSIHRMVGLRRSTLPPSMPTPHIRPCGVRFDLPAGILLAFIAGPADYV
jgi:hypothetical protein